MLQHKVTYVFINDMKCKIKGPGPMSNLRVREYPRKINKRRDKIILRGEVKNARGGFDRVRGL